MSVRGLCDLIRRNLNYLMIVNLVNEDFEDMHEEIFDRILRFEVLERKFMKTFRDRFSLVDLVIKTLR